MWQDFKKFALKGNVMDLAVAVVIGAAFGKIVSSLVADIITPLIGVLMGGIDFTGIIIPVGDAEVMVGNFIQSIVDFLIVAFAIFMVIRILMKFQRKKEAVVEDGPVIDAKEALLTEIRDLLKNQKNDQ
ncbi:large conductance mechanosensitive channel protein MscL [Paenisporosarcina sp. FSL H8-0542]|uniref:large conductance mechanosensitive channel protein MscL n=1 Tax=unclassified Paenisporosarcina TaxID=2642018 RepID=UPI00034E8637|nr:large conductance mechanosensitive channel protein MscL [Paenisporosarcina sp. HGH0030]EPD53849.1 large conductance mechanosensitive channel protein [Paenisporosarcina sp. HGH0030]